MKGVKNIQKCVQIINLITTPVYSNQLLTQIHCTFSTYIVLPQSIFGTHFYSI